MRSTQTKFWLLWNFFADETEIYQNEQPNYIIHSKQLCQFPKEFFQMSIKKSKMQFWESENSRSGNYLRQYNYPPLAMSVLIFHARWSADILQALNSHLNKNYCVTCGILMTNILKRNLLSFENCRKRKCFRNRRRRILALIWIKKPKTLPICIWKDSKRATTDSKFLCCQKSNVRSKGDFFCKFSRSKLKVWFIKRCGWQLWIGATWWEIWTSCHQNWLRRG